MFRRLGQIAEGVAALTRTTLSAGKRIAVEAAQTHLKPEELEEIQAAGKKIAGRVPKKDTVNFGLEKIPERDPKACLAKATSPKVDKEIPEGLERFKDLHEKAVSPKVDPVGKISDLLSVHREELKKAPKRFGNPDKFIDLSKPIA